MTAIPLAERPAAADRASGWRLLPAPAAIAACLLLTLGSPLWLLLLAPLVLGVPHVIGDLRVLVCDRLARHGHTLVIAVLLPLGAMTLLRVAATCGAPSLPRVEIACGMAAILIGAWHGTSARWRPHVMAVAFAATVAACSNPSLTTLVLAHAHNLVALALFLAWSRNRPVACLTLVAYAAAAVTIAISARTVPASSQVLGLQWSAMTASLAPGADTATADRLVHAFAFAQAVHYAIWVWLLPRSTPGTMLSDFGRIGAAVAVCAAIAVPLAACFDAAGARSLYLSLAVAHGWLELAVAAWSFGARR